MRSASPSAQRGRQTLLLRLSLSLITSPICHGLLQSRQTSNPSKDNFLRSAYQSVVVVGDYLYIDGGQISQRNEDPNDGRNPPAMTQTLSIPLTQSWTTANITITATDKIDGAHIRNYPNLFPYSNTFYSWGGGVVNGSQSNEKSRITRFTADGNGSGSWDPSPAGAHAMDSIIANGEGGVTYGKTTGYVVGGFTDFAVDGGYTTAVRLPTPGVVSFDMSPAINRWTNQSARDLSNYGTAYGKAVFLDSYGNSGFILPLGGQAAIDGHSSFFYDSGKFLDFVNLKFFDPDSGEWYAQQARGDFPSPRSRFCAVAVSRAGKSSEVFVFGGWNAQTQGLDTYNDTYVLTLPGFQWFRGSDTTASKRAFHDCALAGKRQMISYGGFEAGLNNTPWYEPDDWGHGIGVMDLSLMKWSSTYSAFAAPYDSPKVVKQWYDAGNLEKMAWDNNTVKNIFMANYITTPLTPKKRHTVAIAVGTVVGFLILTVLGAALYVLARRRRKITQKEGGPISTANYAFNALPVQDYAAECGTDTELHELDPRTMRHELDSRSARHELG